MEVRVLKYNHKGYPMYITAMSGKKIAEISDVDSVDKNPNGYQRERSKGRCKDIKNFIEQTEGLVPGAFLLNVRPEQVEQFQYSKLGEHDGVEFGTVSFPDEKVAWIMDGQHRVGAFEMLEGDVFVPAVFAVGLRREKEGETFNVVNSNQRNVSASLNLYDLMRFADENVKAWTAKDKEADELAYKIVLAMNQSGPWKGRVNMTGVRGMKRAINLKGFTTGLAPVVKDRTFATLPGEKQIELMQAYWQAVEKVWPTALGQDTSSVLNKTFGVHVTCGIAIDVFLYSAQLGDPGVDGMAKLLESTKGTIGDWSAQGPLRSYIGGGRKNVRIVIDALRTRIRNRFEELRLKAPAQPA